MSAYEIFEQYIDKLFSEDELKLIIKMHKSKTKKKRRKTYSHYFDKPPKAEFTIISKK
jgi:hypothetical protein